MLAGPQLVRLVRVNVIQFLGQTGQRQAHNIEIVAFDAFNQRRTNALYSVTTRFVQRFSRRNVPFDDLGRHLPHVHVCGFMKCGHFIVVCQGKKKSIKLIAFE